MIDNFDILKEFYLKHELCKDEDSFLFGQIMARKKDGASICTSNNKIIKDLVIRTPEEFDEKKEEIVTICNSLNARAYLNVNPRSFKRVALELAGVCLDYVRTGGEVAVRSGFATACGRLKTKRSYWVIDVDEPDKDGVIADMIPEIHLVVPTVNGIHYICKGFDLREFRKSFPNIDIHKNNPTLLYAF